MIIAKDMAIPTFAVFDAEADKMEARAKAIRAKHAQEIPQR